MNSMRIAGVALFLVALAGFIVYLPKLDDPGPSVEPVSPPSEGNKSVTRDVNLAATPDTVLQSSVRAVEAEGRGMPIELVDLSGFEVGDTIALFIPQEDVSYEGEIVDVSITKSGNQVITGFLSDPQLPKQGVSYRFIFTVGQHQTFGTIQTGQGRYQLETRGGVGRVISVAVINERLDFSQPDFVMPDRRDLPPEEVTRKTPPSSG